MTLAPPLPLSDAVNSGNATEGKLAVSKDFAFLTFQGEGPRLGRRTLFLRLAGCNLTCNWCDTKYTWDWKHYNIREEVQLLSVYQVAEALDSVDCRSLTITGGEPLLQQKAIERVLLMTRRHWDEINFETNGTVRPYWGETILQPYHYVVSPKLLNSGTNSTQYSLNSLRYFASRRIPVTEMDVDWKFVCQSVDDLDEVASTINRIVDLGSSSPDWPTGVWIRPERVWIMPEGIDAGHANNIAQELAPHVLARGWNLTTRFHLQLWGNARAK